MAEKGRLQTHFENASQSTQSARWDDLWKSGEQDLWDRGKPSPPLIEYLQSSECLIFPMDDGGNRRRALVPGCGTGYDPVMLAQRRFDAWGLEYSELAFETAKKYARENKEGSGDSVHSISNGDVNFIHADFFSQEWQRDLPWSDGKFDLVYDYTFLCALVPESRKDWRKRMEELVKPDGFLICLEFPQWKDNREPGPPWGLKGVHWDLLAEGRDGLVGMDGDSNVADGVGKFERMQYIKPTESYPQGRGVDMLSVWKRKAID